MTLLARLRPARRPQDRAAEAWAAIRYQPAATLPERIASANPLLAARHLEARRAAPGPRHVPPVLHGVPGGMARAGRVAVPVLRADGINHMSKAAGEEDGSRLDTGRQDVTGTAVTDTWISAETEVKERDFRGILSMHATICKGIRQRHGITAPYLYADLYAGPGNLSYHGRAFDGSPLIARDILTQAALPYEAVHFERDPQVAGRLREALRVPASLLDIPDPDTSPVYSETCQAGFPRWLGSAGRQRDRHGIVYSDPIGDPIPVDLFNQAAEQFPHVDLLAYVSANSQYKRKGGSSRQRWLADDIRAVNKRVVLVRRPRTAFQWTFILWSNWANLPEWEKRGFYRLDSATGEQILDQLNLTAREHREKANTPLFGERHYRPPAAGDAPYRSYAEYLRHPRFLAVRAQVFQRAAGACERCGMRPPAEPHHIRYPPWGAFDVPENLIAVCHECHCEIHGKAA